MTVTPIVGRARGCARRGLLVELSADGVRGIGEASPLSGRSPETLDDVRAALTDLGSHVEIELADPMASIELTLPASLRFALETAAVRLAHAIRSDAPAVSALETQVLGDDLTSIASELRAYSRGARSFKLKIRSATDAHRVMSLREQAPDARIRVDANRSFSRARDVPWDLLRAARVEWIEEPTPAAYAIEDPQVPIALDESVEDARERATEAIAQGRVAAVVLKPTLLGARGALSLAETARAHGVRTIVSHAFESEVGLSAASELASLIAPGECHGLAPWDGIESFRREEAPLAPSLV